MEIVVGQELERQENTSRTFREALTFDDVLLVPKRSSVASRMDVDLSTRITRNIELNIPIVSMDMSTVTESAMAICMAQQGGIGIIHRFLSIEREVAEIKRVKRSENTVIEKPFTIKPTDTIERAVAEMEKHGVSGLVVIDESGKLVGMLTSRDLMFETGGKLVSEVMTTDPVVGKAGAIIEDLIELMRKNKVEKVPLVDENNVLKGLVTARDVLKKRAYPNACRDPKGRLRVGACIGIRGDYKERTAALLEAEADLIAIDVAHGHLERTLEVTRELKKEFGCELLVGNVATSQGTRDLIEAGADGVDVGVGNGSICITRLIAGTGVPQLTALMDCAAEAKKHEVPLVADGGMSKPGDLVKALAAGASCGKFGMLFAGTDEAPGRIVMRNNKRYKLFYGMASWTAQQGLAEPERTPEGVESMAPYKGSVKEIIANLLGGLRSGMSYSNGHNIAELQRNAEFIRITNAGLKESHAHDVEAI